MSSSDNPDDGQRRLSRSSDGRHDNNPLLGPSSGSPNSGAVICRASLEYVGFSPQKADNLWYDWTDWSNEPGQPTRETDDNPVCDFGFLDFITHGFHNYRNVSHDSDSDWLDSMAYHGMNEETQSAIMDPTFKVLRLSRSCTRWCKDTVEMRYAGLEEAKRRRSQPQPAATEGQTTSGSLSRAPGSVVLYKAYDKARIRHFLNRSRPTIPTVAGGDFFYDEDYCYFTPSLDVAKYNAAWAKRRSMGEEIVIIAITIPNSAIDQLKKPYIYSLDWQSDVWKKLVWHCRGRRRPPDELSKYENATLIIGPIAKWTNSYYKALESWEQVSDECVVKMVYPTHEAPAIQYCFPYRFDEDDFVKDNVTSFQVLPFGDSDMESLRDVVMA